MDNVNEFVVATEGQCFFCLSQILNPTYPNSVPKYEPDASTPSFNSIHCFSRYLGMDMRKVFKETETIPAALLSKVERSRLKVQLCEDCAVTIDNFSRLYEQLEKIELEMSFYIKHIQGKLVAAENDRRTKFNSTGEYKGKHEIVEVLRTESLQKCSSKLSKSAPRLKVHNLTMNQVNVKTKKKREDQIPIFNPEEIPPSSEQRWEADVKLERCNLKPPPNEDESQDNDNYSDYDNPDQFQNDYDDDNPNLNYNTRRQQGLLSTEDKLNGFGKTELKVKKSSVTTIASSTTSKLCAEAAVAKSIFNPKTGKHKCQVCSKEFAAKCSFRLHYKSVHMQVKYKCKLCGQEFATKGSYDRHHKGVHEGVKFKCGICDKIFSQKSALSSHQTSAHSGIHFST